MRDKKGGKIRPLPLQAGKEENPHAKKKKDENRKRHKKNQPTKEKTPNPVTCEPRGHYQPRKRLDLFDDKQQKHA